MRRRSLVIAAISVVVMGSALAACSSGGKGGTVKTPSTLIITAPTSSTTTLPEAQLRADLAVLFGPKGAGQKLLAFERLTAPWASGTVPPAKDCKAVTGPLGQIGSSSALFAIAGSIPDGALAKAWHDEIAGKRLLIATCQVYVLPATAGPQIKALHDRLVALMATHGYTL